MKGRVIQSELAFAAKMAATVSKDQVRPILACTKLESRPDALLVSGTNLEDSFVVDISQWEHQADGAAVVPAELLLECAKSMSDDAVQLSAQNGDVKLLGLTRTFSLRTMAVDDFPPVEIPKGGTTYPSANICRGLRLVQNTAAREPTRYAISSIHFFQRNGKLWIETTNGRSGAFFCAGECKEKIDALIRPQSVPLLLAAMGRHEDAELLFGKTAMSVRCGGTMASTRLVEGHFPYASDFIKQPSDGAIELPVAEFAEAVKTASIGCDPADSPGVILDFCADFVMAKSGTGERGEFQATCNGKGGSAGITKLNPKYLLPILQALRAEKVETIKVDVLEKRRPFRFYADNFCGAVMPMNME